MAKPFTLNLVLPDKTITLEADASGQVWRVSDEVSSVPDHELKLSSESLEQLRAHLKPQKKSAENP